jgi:hypothetical protein
VGKVNDGDVKLFSAEGKKKRKKISPSKRNFCSCGKIPSL